MKLRFAPGIDVGSDARLRRQMGLLAGLRPSVVALRFSNRHAHRPVSELLFCVTDMSATLVGCSRNRTALGLAAAARAVDTKENTSAAGVNIQPHRRNGSDGRRDPGHMRNPRRESQVNSPITASRQHGPQSAPACRPGGQPVTAIAVDYGRYAVTYVVSHNCPESRWKPSRLAGVRAGSHGLVVFGRW